MWTRHAVALLLPVDRALYSSDGQIPNRSNPAEFLSRGTACRAHAYLNTRYFGRTGGTPRPYEYSQSHYVFRTSINPGRTPGITHREYGLS